MQVICYNNLTMTKIILLYKDTVNNRDAFADYITQTVIPPLNRQNPDSLKVTLSRSRPPRISVIPFSEIAIACVSITGMEFDSKSLEQQPHFWGAYHVTQALPVAYSPDWPPHTPTPGACLLTLFNRKKHLTDEQFFHRWHNGHTPLSLNIHPLWNYNRNVVTHTITGVPFEGIVEEQVKEARELLNPIRFFGGPLRMGWNMVRTFVDTKSFIDYKTMETYLTEETWFIRPTLK